MSMLDYQTYEEALAEFTVDQVWELFDGTPENFNLGLECVDRHKGKGTFNYFKEKFGVPPTADMDQQK